MATSLFDRIRQIKREHRPISRNIDRYEREIRLRLESIKREINHLDKHDQDLVTILVINGLHRTADEVLID